MEEWRKIEGFDNYEVSNFGRIRTLEYRVRNRNGTRIVRSRIRKLILDKWGYYMVHLKKSTKTYPQKVHRLVAEAFMSNPENKPQINHKNCIKTDNRASNLEWVTQSENVLHSYRNGHKGNGLRKPVKCSLGTFDSSYAAAEYVNANIFRGTKKIRHIASRIRRCAAGFQSMAYGFKWEYDSN